MGLRSQDDNIGRFTSIDPKWEEFPDQTPYNYAENNPVLLKDPNGDNPWLLRAAYVAVEVVGTAVAAYAGYKVAEGLTKMVQAHPPNSAPAMYNQGKTDAPPQPQKPSVSTPAPAPPPDDDKKSFSNFEKGKAGNNQAKNKEAGDILRNYLSKEIRQNKELVKELARDFHDVLQKYKVENGVKNVPKDALKELAKDFAGKANGG